MYEKIIESLSDLLKSVTSVEMHIFYEDEQNMVELIGEPLSGESLLFKGATDGCISKLQTKFAHAATYIEETVRFYTIKEENMTNVA